MNTNQCANDTAIATIKNEHQAELALISNANRELERNLEDAIAAKELTESTCRELRLELQRERESLEWRPKIILAYGESEVHSVFF